MTKGRRLGWLGHAARRPDNNLVKKRIFTTTYEGTRTCAAYRTALWDLDALCYEGCEGHGTANGLP